ncbi:Enolase [uncultured archaeon]|nr:Enolase [uncultured archaeon]
MPVTISSVRGFQRLDSRGNPTVEAQVELSDGTRARALAPSGASTGTFEAMELRDGGKAWGGKGVSRAVANVNGAIAKALRGQPVSSQEKIDTLLCELDGTPNKSRLGANATTAVSMAVWQATAASASKGAGPSGAGRLSGTGPYALMGGTILPVPFLNVINGGKHAGSGLAVQECMLAPVGFSSFSEALQAGTEVYHALGSLIVHRYGPAGKNVGDEGGFAPTLQTTKEALDLLEDAISGAGYSKKIKVGMDAAASSFFDSKSGRYVIDGTETDADSMVDYWAALCKDYPLVSLEDPFDEEDYAHFAQLKAKAGARAQIVGDDLTVTNLRRLKKAREAKAISCLLLKVNQIGTLSEAIECAQYCRSHHLGVMVSHRSGETEDTTIADLTVGLGFGQLKSGAPCRAERTAKYNRLLAIEEELGRSAKFLGEKALVRN